MLVWLKIIAFLNILLCVLVCTNDAALFPPDDNITSRVRLPSGVQPTNYFLHITTRIHEDILPYDGKVVIDLVIKELTAEIVLHAKLLHSFKVTLRDLQTDRELEGLRYIHEQSLNFLRIFSVSKPLDLKPGEQYRLEIFFRGEHQSANFGFYRDTYFDDNDNVVPLAITQFEPTNARDAFPCFDEPQLKARFVISITHGSNYTALSNMPVDGAPTQSPDSQMTTTTFLRTPRMSTYLIAFAVTNYHHISESVNGREHRVFFPPNSRDNGSHALKNAISSLTVLENYFGIEYSLPKLDHIRVAKTYGMAMENWGLITYNNKNFVTNLRNTSLSELNKIISQNHELVHQWFGNLVSPKWWTFVWLKEGFAVYFSYITTQLIFPERKVIEYFVSSEVRHVIKHYYHYPMTRYVDEENDIKLAYNRVSYKYGACFVRMFHHAIGHKTFIKGLSLYLSRFQYSVADEEDLFAALQEAIDEDDVKLFKSNKTAVILRSWTQNIGIPIIKITRNYNNETITIRQQPKGEFGGMWWIPLAFATTTSPHFDITTADYIMPPEIEVTIRLKDLNLNLENSDWLIVDKQQTGLFCVIYDDRNVGLIAEALNKDHTQIHVFNRAKILLDLATFAENQDVSVENLLNVMQYLKFEQDLIPWENAGDLILWLYYKLQHGRKTTLDMFKAFIRDLVRDAFQKIYNPAKDDLSVYDITLKDKILKIACEVDLTDCLKYTQKLANDYFLLKLDNENFKTDFALCQGLKIAAFEEFKNLVSKVVAPERSIVKFYEFVFSLKCVNSVENLRYFLEVLFNKSSPSLSTLKDKRKDMYAENQALSIMYMFNLEARPMIYEFLQEKDKDFANAIRDRSTKTNREIESELLTREEFRTKYEGNIVKWLEENYARRGTTLNQESEV